MQKANIPLYKNYFLDAMNRSLRIAVLVLIPVFVIIATLIGYYHVIGRSAEIEETYVTITNIVTLTYVRTITSTLQETQRTTITVVMHTDTITAKTSTYISLIKLGEELSIVKPFLYHEHIVYHEEDPKLISKSWIIEGQYLTQQDGVIIWENDTCSLAYNNLVKLEAFRAYWLNLTISEQHGPIRFVLYSDDIAKRVLELEIDEKKTMTVYVDGRRASYQRSIDLKRSTDIELLLVSSTINRVELFIRRTGIDDYWVVIAQIESPSLIYQPKLALEICNSSIILRGFRVNLAAGTGIRDLRPIFDWSSGKYNPRSFLEDDEEYMLFFATESYFANGFTTILFLRTKDLLHYEPVKSIIIGRPGYSGQGVLFKWIDGRIHGFLMDWGSGRPPFQGGLHRILKVVLDENLNCVEVNTDVKFINAPLGGSMGHYDITVFKYKGTWYAITSSFTGGTILWRLNDPTSTTFTYVKVIFPGDFENPMIYPVRAPNGDIQFLLSVATAMKGGVQWHRIYILDEGFNPIRYYDLVRPEVYSGGHSFYLDPWYLYIHQDQIPEWRFINWDIGPGAYIRIYKLATDYEYYIEES